MIGKTLHVLMAPIYKYLHIYYILISQRDMQMKIDSSSIELVKIISLPYFFFVSNIK